MGEELLHALRQQQGTGFLDEPLRARWQLLFAPTTANIFAFSPTGSFLALGTTDGVVHVWELASGRTLVRSLCLADALPQQQQQQQQQQEQQQQQQQ